MDDYTTDYFGGRSVERDESNVGNTEREDYHSDASDATTSKRRKGLRSKVAALREKASVQDKLLEKLANPW
jgi:hypothetical protein